MLHTEINLCISASYTNCDFRESNCLRRGTLTLPRACLDVVKFAIFREFPRSATHAVMSMLPYYLQPRTPSTLHGWGRVIPTDLEMFVSDLVYAMYELHALQI